MTAAQQQAAAAAPVSAAHLPAGLQLQQATLAASVQQPAGALAVSAPGASAGPVLMPSQPVKVELVKAPFSIPQQLQVRM